MSEIEERIERMGFSLPAAFEFPKPNRMYELPHGIPVEINGEFEVYERRS